MPRNSVIVIICMILLIDATSHARSTATSTAGRSFLKYYSGIVQSASNDGIVLNNKTYAYAQNVKIRAHEKSKGAFKEVDARISEIRAGSPVIIRAEGASVYEIIIERWKQ
jgi:hypothetical protein